MSGCLRWGVPESGALPSQMADKRRLTGMDELSRGVWMVWSDHCTGCSRQLFVDELGGIVDELGRMVDELVTRPGFRGNCPIPAAPTHDGFFKVVFSQPQTTTEPTITGTCETPTPSTSNPMKNVGVSHSWVSHIQCLTFTDLGVSHVTDSVHSAKRVAMCSGVASAVAYGACSGKSASYRSTSFDASAGTT